MENQVHAFHSLVHAAPVAHIADVKLYFRIIKPEAHMLLLKLVAAENADLFKILSLMVSGFMPERSVPPVISTVYLEKPFYFLHSP